MMEFIYKSIVVTLLASAFMHFCVPHYESLEHGRRFNKITGETQYKSQSGYGWQKCI